MLFNQAAGNAGGSNIKAELSPHGGNLSTDNYGVIHKKDVKPQ
jgi:hypothetical protein